MMTSQTAPIDAARARLHAALLAGQDTRALRLAIEKLEAAARIAQERQAAEAAEAATRRTDAIQARAAAVAGEMQARVDAVLTRFPVPEAKGGAS